MKMHLMRWRSDANAFMAYFCFSFSVFVRVGITFLSVYAIKYTQMNKPIMK